MEVGGTTRVDARTDWARRGTAATTGFSLPAAAAGRTLAAAPVSEGLVALQAGDAAVRDREARRRGGAALQALAALQRALLAGEADPEALRALAASCEGPEASDPALAATLRAVSLRARVELARRGL